MDLGCNKHEISKTKVQQSIQECCRDCLRILSFKQIEGYFSNGYLDNINDFNNKLFRESLDERTVRRCSDCYRISFECVESTLVKKQISILYLPWWCNSYSCINCSSRLIITSDCQKYCENCFISYIGCRYCLTTNIIFGLTGQTQCRKCKRISLIIYSNVDRDLVIFLLNDIIYENYLDFDYIAKIVNSIDKYLEPNTLLHSIFKKKIVKNDNIMTFGWIPYSQFKNIEEKTKGGYGIIYKANWRKIWPKYGSYREVILKRFENSKDNIKYFLNELKSNQHCKNKPLLIEVYGFTKDPESDDYILVMEYASGGDLHEYLQWKFTDIEWWNKWYNYNGKLSILQNISKGLEYIHDNKFIHRDFHSGNILAANKWKIGDLGLSQPENNESPNNEIYGVIPYIAPEIFKGAAFSKETDIYSFGMIMWELTTGCKPFTNVKHDIHLIYKILDGKRPNITEDTPKCYANLMKSCWDPDPKKRPPIKEICLTFYNWYDEGENKEEFVQAEEKRNKLIESKKIGPEFAEKYHPEAIYTSRPLSALISKCLSTNSSSIISFGNNQDYDYNYISKENELDISLPQNITIQNFSTSLKKRNNEDEIQDDSEGKRIKTS
ncbi:unnamed protein product [Rhizophagus irregularis]|nr:unnamed protein product [Rhizophagus irregularis]